MKSQTIDAARVRAVSDQAGGTHAVILTEFRGATNTLGARIVARLAGAGKRPRVAIGYPYELNQYDAHTAAALALLDSMRRDGDAMAPVIVSAGATEGGYAYTLDTAPAF